MIAKKDIPYYVFAVLLFILLKFSFSFSSTDDLYFLLSPTKTIVEVLTGFQSIYINESGYFYEQLGIVIDKSCSGFNFWLLCFLLLSFVSIKFFEKSFTKIGVLSVSFILAYIFTIIVNSFRIYTSIIIQNQQFQFASESIIHESIGVITNITFLFLMYLLTDRILTKHFSNEKLT